MFIVAMFLGVLEWFVMFGHCRSMSCSMELAAVADSGPPMAEASAPPLASPPRLQLTLLPHEGFVAISGKPGAQVLTQKRTLGQQAFPQAGSPWLLVFDEHGWGALVSESSGEYLLLEDWMRRHLYASSTAEHFVSDRAAGGSRTRPWNLSATLPTFDVKEVELPTSAGAVSLEAYNLQWACGGCSVCWSMHHLFLALGLSGYKGSAADWCHARMPVWERHVRQWSSETHFFKSFYHIHDLCNVCFREPLVRPVTSAWWATYRGATSDSAHGVCCIGAHGLR